MNGYKKIKTWEYLLLQVDEEEIKALRDRLLETRRAVHKVTEEEVSKRWSYEEGVSLMFARFKYHTDFILRGAVMTEGSRVADLLWSRIQPTDYNEDWQVLRKANYFYIAKL